MSNSAGDMASRASAYIRVCERVIVASYGIRVVLCVAAGGRFLAFEERDGR